MTGKSSPTERHLSVATDLLKHQFTVDVESVGIQGKDLAPFQTDSRRGARSRQDDFVCKIAVRKPYGTIKLHSSQIQPTGDLPLRKRNFLYTGLKLRELFTDAFCRNRRATLTAREPTG